MKGYHNSWTAVLAGREVASRFYTHMGLVREEGQIVDHGNMIER